MPVTNYYTVGNEIIGEKTTGGSRVDYLTDMLGSVTATVNQSAQVVNTYRNKPYGTQLAKTGVGADPAFLWVGSKGYRQTSNKFSEGYVRARHFNAVTGCWNTQDPLSRLTYEYIYVHANPVIRTDPSGLIPVSVFTGNGCPPKPSSLQNWLTTDCCDKIQKDLNKDKLLHY